MYFKFFGKIYVKYEWIIFILASFLSEHKHYFYTMLIMCFLHEMCHFFAACLLGVKVRCFIIHLIGFEINTGMGTYKKDLIIAAAGPLGSMLFLLFGVVVGDEVLIHTNLSVLLINLLPALPLDGGRILKILLLRKKGCLQSDKIMKIFSLVVSFFVLLISCIKRSFWLLSVALFVFYSRNKFDTRLYCMTKKEANLPEKTIKPAIKWWDYKIINYMSPYYKVCVKDGDKTVSEEEIIINMLGK